MEQEPNTAEPPKPRRRWFQFRLRRLLIAVVVCGAVMRWVAVTLDAARGQSRAVETIQTAGGHVIYDEEPSAPAWMGRIFGPEACKRVIGVSFHTPNVADSDLVPIENLHELKTLFAEKCGTLTSAGLAHLGRLNHLQLLDLQITALDDGGLEQLSSLQSLQTLHLGGNAIGDAELQQICQLSGLRNLELAFTQITDAGLIHLKPLANLKTLTINDSSITDTGLEQLMALGQLRLVFISRTRATGQGIERLRVALPNCAVYFR